jgi:hypothetical protein
MTLASISMWRLARSMFLLLIAGAPIGPAAAQPEPARWISRWDDDGCQLARAVGTPLADRLAVKTMPGSGVASLWLRIPPSRSAPSRSDMRAEVTFAPAGTAVPTGAVIRSRDADGFVYAIYAPERAVLESLSTASGIRIQIDGVQLLDLHWEHASDAVNALRQCINDQLHNWGMDPVSLASLRQLPTPMHPRGLSGYVSDADYPVYDIRGRGTGTTIVRLDIDRNGQVSACTLLVGSGDRTLDYRTCSIFSRRARFRPALDADGAPTDAPLVTSISWRLHG